VQVNSYGFPSFFGQILFVTIASSGERRKGRSGLVCFDERHISKLIQVNLDRQGYFITCVSNVKKAIEILEETELKDRPQFELALIDGIRLDGYEILKWMRTHDSTQLTWVTITITEQELSSWEQRPYQPDKYTTLDSVNQLR